MVKIRLKRMGAKKAPFYRIVVADSKVARDGIAIADQGGWARHSRSMLGYMQRDDGWDDNASAGLA